MKKYMASILLIFIWILIGIEKTTEETPFTALFAFGDSLIDPGNNNNLISLAKANYSPYGVDFDEGPSGRFCNGKTFVDYLGELVGIPPLPAYSSISGTTNLLNGVNYASAAGGIMEESGQFLGQRFSLSQQINNFNNTLNEVKNKMKGEDLIMHLGRALVVMNLGSNDYVNNYLIPSLYSTSSSYTPEKYSQLLVTRYGRYISVLHRLGLRKFFLTGVGPLGCIPNQIATGVSTQGKCVEYTNQVVGLFNSRLVSLVDELNTKYDDSIFVYGNSFDVFMDILSNAKAYGFSVINEGCCGLGRYQGQVTCLPLSVPCSERDRYVFWDAFHPTRAVNRILADRAYAGPTPYCYPINVRQMAEM